MKKKSYLIFITGMFLFLATLLGCNEEKLSPMNISQLKQYLNLTEAQVKKATPIITEYISSLETLKPNRPEPGSRPQSPMSFDNLKKSPSEHQNPMKKIEVLEKNLITKLESILTQEQIDKLKELLKKQKEEQRKNRPQFHEPPQRRL